MTKRGNGKRTKRIVMGVALVLALCTLGLGAGQEAGQAGNAYHKKNERPAGKLYEMGKKLNKQPAHMTFQSERSVVAADVKEMARRSTDIIVGRALKNRAYMNDEGDQIERILTIYVQDVFKGAIINGSGIEVKTVGGSWLYSDGTAISWYPADARMVQDGRSYVLFLRKDKEQYVPSLGIQSIFEIDFDTKSILPNDLFKLDPVVGKYQNAPLSEFLREVKSAAR